MPSIEHYRKQARLLMRWHRERNHSVGGKLRSVARFRHLTDVEALAMAMPLALAQEVVAVEAGFADWAALGRQAGEPTRREAPGAPSVTAAIPILFVRDVSAAAHFYAETLGGRIDFLHGNPPFYGSVSRDALCLHLRHVGAPNFADLAAREPSLILATIETSDVKALFDEFAARGADFAQRLVRQAWGGLDFHLRDPDGNVISFVQYDRA